MTSATEERIPISSRDRDRDRLLLVPTVRREFAQSDELRLQIPPGLPGLSVRVLREDGGAAAEVDAPVGPLRLPLSELAPGSYLLELTVGSGEDERRIVFFRVLPSELDRPGPPAGFPSGQHPPRAHDPTPAHRTADFPHGSCGP